MKNRIISFVLAIIILLPLLPSPAIGKGFVKEIDVIQDDFDFKVEGKNISSKELFIYDGELWVPLKDLGPALNLRVNFNPDKRIFWINSQGKLSIGDDSKANIAFQRGYEIQAKERIIGELNDEIQAFDGKLMSKASENSIVKNISVGFANINVHLDNIKLDLNKEPLIYNDDLYVSLIDISPYLYITPSLMDNTVNIDGNSILVKKEGYDSFDDLAKFRDSLNNRLGTQLAEMEKRKKIIMDVQIPYEDIKTLSSMEKYLNKHLGKISELAINISLRSGNDHWYYLDIDFLKKDNKLWLDLNRRDVEAHIWDIFVALTSLYDEDAKIQGNIRNPQYSSNSTSSKANYVEFNTNLKDLEFNFINSNLDLKGKVDPILIEDILKKYLGKYSGESFYYSAKLSGSNLDLVVRPGSGDYIEKWSPDNKLRLLREINYEIKRHYPNLKVNGKVEYPGKDIVHFLIEDGKIASSYILNEFTDKLNKYYKTFKTGNLSIPMEYKIIQKDLNNYNLLVNMDFDKDDSSWSESSRNDLAKHLQNIVTEIISLWNVNVSVKAFDKKQNLLSDFLVSQDTVQGVLPSPNPGNIVEGSSVSLQTSTPNASIYYTIDGTNPSESNGSKYSNPIIINKDTIIKAYAVKEGSKDSPLYEFKYTVVSDENMASGLDKLELTGGTLQPSFNKRQYDYKLNVSDSTEKITLRPSASKGTITINGKEISNNESMEVDLEDKDIKIKHIEKNKLDRLYTIKIVRKDDGQNEPDKDEEINLNPNYTFSTTLIANFQGQLSGSKDFSGYKIELRSDDDSNVLYKSFTLGSSGSFKITDFPIDIFDKIFGYKYIIKDPSNNFVIQGTLRNQSGRD